MVWKFKLAIVVLAVVICCGSRAWADNIDVIDPAGLSSNINTLGYTVEQQAGNYTISQFNANENTYNHTFNVADGYGADMDRLNSTTLMQAVSGIDLVTYYYKNSGGYGRIITDYYPTGGADSYVMASAGTHSMVFDRDVQGVGFTVNRCYVDVDIKLFDKHDNQIGSIYTLTDNASSGGSGHSFFGYYDPSAAIRKVEWTTSGSNQLSLDDFAVIVDSSDPPPADVSQLPDLSGITGASIDESNVSYILHVSVSGDNNNPGTLAEPFRTVNKAAQVAAGHQQNNDGVKVIIHPGMYREYVDALMGGYDTPDGITAPIVFEAQEPGTAILSASEIYTGWTRQGSSDIYTHSWPHDWGLYMEPPWDNLPIYRQQKFLNNPILRRIEMFFADGEHLTQVLTYDHYDPHDDPGVTELENSFYVDEANDLVYIHLPAGSDINSMTIESAERMYVFGASGIRNLVIRGLVFQHAANTLNIGPSDGGDGALYIESGVNVLLEDNLFQWNNGTGYSFYSTWEEPTGTYRVYSPCEEVTVRRNVSNYNGFGGFELNVARDWICEDNEESYNNWRGAQGSWAWDNSGRALGLYSGWTGTRFYRMHFAIIRRHKAIGNYARGIWFDYDNMHILYEDGLLHDNMTGLKFEVDPGPIHIKDTVITDNGMAGILVAIADHTTIENCVITGNGHLASLPSWEVSGQAQIRIDKSLTSHYVNPWDGLLSAYIMEMETWTMFDTVIGGSAANPVMKTPDTATFLNSQTSEQNYWYHTSSTDVFEIGSTTYDFAGWQSLTGQDGSSTFSLSAPEPGFCGDFGTTYPTGDIDSDCDVNIEDFALMAAIWAERVCQDPLVVWPEDLYHDCYIDIKDMAVLAKNWLDSTNPN